MYKCVKFSKKLKILLSVIIVICVGFYFSSAIFSNADVVEDSNTNKGIFLPVIMYHSIYDDVAKNPDYIVTPSTLENDLKYLHSNGYHSVLTQDLLNYIHYNKPLPEKPVMITFDDGYYNNLYYALGLLKKYDMKAVISVVGTFTENEAAHDPEIPAYSYLTWENISELYSSGLVEIGNHTYNLHRSSPRKGCSRLPGETEENYHSAIYEDIGSLQSLLAENCSITPVTFAYPYGSLTKESIPVLRSLGFQCSLNCFERPNYIVRDPDCLFSLNRYNRSSRNTTEAFMKKALSE